jgi:hypothetical protein
MTIRDNQRRMVANALRAGKGLTAAQKANFSASEIASIRSGLKPDRPSKAISLAASKASLGRTVKGLTGVKKAGQSTRRRRATKITGGRGAAPGREKGLARKRIRRVKTGTGAGGDIKRRRGT